MKKILGLAILATVMGASLAFAEEAKEVNVNVDGTRTVNVNVNKAGIAKPGINWEKNDAASITAMGSGLPGMYQGAQGRVMARRAAIVECYRNLAEFIQGVQIDSETVMENLTVKSDVVKSKVAAIVKGAKIIEEYELPDGSYVVKMSVPMYGVSGSVAAAVMPEVMKDTPVAEPPMKVSKKDTVLSKAEYKEARTVEYSGVVIDAAGMGLECTMAPQIIDTNGRVIYGMDNIDVDFAVSHGLVEYTKDLQAASGGSTRAGSNPLVVKANGVKGGSNSVNPVNVVVSPEDADRILLAAQKNGSMFARGAIVFVR